MQLSTVVGGADSNIEPGICYKSPKIFRQRLPDSRRPSFLPKIDEILRDLKPLRTLNEKANEF